jgi:hypothetical protein
MEQAAALAPALADIVEQDVDRPEAFDSARMEIGRARRRRCSRPPPSASARPARRGSCSRETGRAFAVDHGDARALGKEASSAVAAPMPWAAPVIATAKRPWRQWLMV